MDNLKIIKAIYYDPQMGVKYGADVTDELSAEIVESKLFYNGIYNLIFPDPFVGKPKRLRVEIEHAGRKSTKFYNENEKINLPHDLGKNSGDSVSNEGRVAVSLTKSARNNVFINSHIHGGVEIAGEGNSFIDTTINTLRETKEKYPFWFWVTVFGTSISIVTGLMFLGQYFGLIPNSFDIHLPVTTKSNLVATSTPNLATILSKNNSFTLSSEKQDFIKNYSDTIVYGTGSFVDLIKMDQGYTMLMTISNNEVGCQFSFDSEKELILLGKGQAVTFTGRFTGQGLGGYGAVNPWYVTDCSLLK